MEEILASIRRIISDEEPDEKTAAPPAPPVEDDVLDLLDKVAAPPSEPAFLEDDLEVFSIDDPEDALDEILSGMEALDSEPGLQDVEPREDVLVSNIAQAAAASAFGKLAQTVAMPELGRSLEDVVRELLRPLLKAWLDENLLPIVQAKVDEEVSRIARRRS